MFPKVLISTTLNGTNNRLAQREEPWSININSSVVKKSSLIISWKVIREA
jgi:hypothetical protein